MRLAIVGAALVTLAACSGNPFRCDEPRIRFAELDGRSARNSVSDCIIEVDPHAPYAAAILAQELFEWRYKRDTGKSITLRREIESHEREVQAAVALYGVTERDYRIAEAHLMLGHYDFAAEDWTHKEIVEAMQAEAEPARADVDGYMPELLAFRERLQKWSAGGE